MLQNYGKITWRSLAKNRVYSAINIVGLAIGMTVATLIGLWLWDELSFNQYHQKAISVQPSINRTAKAAT